ncbi:branched-chain amino acid ABC transporter permease [Paramaledivibacter caminithermalis]|jgi:branched-chain amino acid transport system permease protein|uniref:Amino acid/amide ABC transporter membrane protein 2, HAAT family n=1 Tax=Paramaledivibacter caminithermalis (strain DSM 15212 / CIP 107654 / DViRD3) TaxID=1121301 RepID=A0A1M6NX18_PARC5|nr:branched-chain amino acid ABC transporter permease [Paramaledivibacter caminithermalis]SHK00275.1 amino acid/amide ABC transporter membrane protein 2, HAAT family [Paramaledivibacter caminithermalis DSM 15212]
MKKNNILTLISIIGFILLLLVLNITLGSYKMRIFNLCGIYVILALSLNLINGFVGLFSLGHAGFMAVGAYTCALLTMSPETKEMNFFLEPIVPWLKNVQLPFPTALIIGGIMAAIAGALIGAPVLRLRDDYLAIATLGFSEIIRVVFTNTQRITNGPLGIKGLPTIGITGQSWEIVIWTWGIALFTIIFMVLLINSSYGKAFKAIREDEIAAEAMGINLFKHKMIAFVIGSFFAGIGGALLGHLMGTIDPLMFRFLLTFNIVLIVVLGGIGSITGSVISAIVVTISMEALRILDADMQIGGYIVKGIPGMRMVVFSALLMIVILFYQRGLMGTNEFNWDWIINRKKKIQKI